MAAVEARPTEPDRGNERPARRTVTREFRPRRTVPAVIVALLLAVASALVAIELISRLVDRPLGILPADDLARLGRETQWNDPLTYTVAIIAGLLGLLLLAIALWPGRARARALSPARRAVTVAVADDDLGRLAEQAAESVSGVDRAHARAQRRQLAVRVDSPLHDPGDLDGQIQHAVSERLDQLQLLRSPQLRVNVRHRED